MERQPKISVVMGVCNCERTLAAAVDSVFSQTYDSWELILCDDGSTDGTYALAKAYAEKYPDRVILLRNDRNRKLAYTLNRCLEAASGELVARMDADDLSHPGRFRKQVEYLLAHPDIQLVGTAMRPFDDAGSYGVMHPPLLPDGKNLMRGTPFFHATVMTYKRVYDELGGYSVLKRTERVEDIDLWFRFFARGFSGRNIDEPLYLVREDFAAVRRRTLQARIHSIQTRYYGYKLLGFPLRRLILPAAVLFLKGLVPPHLARLIKKRRITGRL